MVGHSWFSVVCVLLPIDTVIAVIGESGCEEQKSRAEVSAVAGGLDGTGCGCGR